MESLFSAFQSEFKGANTEAHTNRYIHNTEALQHYNKITEEIHPIHEQDFPTLHLLHFSRLPNQGVGQPGLPPPIVLLPGEQEATWGNSQEIVISWWLTVKNNWLAVGNGNTLFLM